MFQNKSFERENSSKKIKDRMNEKRQLFREFPAKKSPIDHHFSFVNDKITLLL